MLFWHINLFFFCFQLCQRKRWENVSFSSLLKFFLMLPRSPRLCWLNSWGRLLAKLLKMSAHWTPELALASWHWYLEAVSVILTENDLFWRSRQRVNYPWRGSTELCKYCANVKLLIRCDLQYWPLTFPNDFRNSTQNWQNRIDIRHKSG